MIVTVETRECPYRVFDANGTELKHVLYCDTETGEVEQFETEDGVVVVVKDKSNPGDFRFNRVRLFHPAPLRLEKMTAAFDQAHTSFVTRDDIIQAAISSIDNEERRAAYQARFDEDREQAYSGFGWRGGLGSRSFGQLMRSSNRMEVDPEKLKRWIAIAKILLPIILGLL